jgi:hypothetical protein
MVSGVKKIFNPSFYVGSGMRNGRIWIRDGKMLESGMKNVQIRIRDGKIGTRIRDPG